MKIIFYDINLKNLQKYISDIVDKMIIDGQEIVLLYDEYDQEGYDYYSNKECLIMQNKALTYNGIQKILLNLKPDLFMVNAQRLSDSAFVTVAKSLNIKTGMIQHGMYIPFMKREKYYLIKKVLKTIKYFMYSQVIAKTINKNRLFVFKSFYNTFVKGVIYKDAVNFIQYVNVDFILVYGEYWKEYHKDVFGYKLEQQYIIGYHELNKVDAINSKQHEEDAVCYIAQTLVEDGRLDRNIMEEFLINLLKYTPNKTIYVKLHPRTDKSLFLDKRFILLEKEIPNCRLYVGHYSSLIALLGYLKGDIVLYEFEGHSIPFYFKEFSNITNDYKDILHTVSNNSNKIEPYFASGYTTSKVVNLIYKKINTNNLQ
jgi:hypothetical protein